MSELKEISVIMLKHLSKALLSAAHEISKSLGKNHPIIESSPPPLDCGISVLFQYKTRRYWAEIIKIDGDMLTVENKSVAKTFTISTSEVISRDDINYPIDDL
ncbi:hypothetical protein HCU40_16670 [Pseudanabaena biceps]|nr:hypothetical protein [Pseudanabaena biceps]